MVFSPASVFDALREYRHPAGVLDYNLGYLWTFIFALTLTTPHTSGYTLFRRAIAAPIIVVGWLYFAWVPYIANDSEQWGVTLLMSEPSGAAHAMRALELLVFFPAEEHVYRVRAVPAPPANGHRDKHSDHNGEPRSKSDRERGEQSLLLPEPIPPPFTLAKLYWALSLFWSWRGIGWNYSCPLPHSSRRHPFTRSSSRRDFLILRIRNTFLLWASWDVFRTITNLSPMALFMGNANAAAPAYADWNTLEKAIISIMIPARIIIDMEKSHLGASILFVGIGGMMGWEGEIWSPWGWPPLFGSFDEILRYPGLATMWSRTWQGYFRRWLHVLGWIGIGENLFGLTHSGDSSRPRVLSGTSEASTRLHAHSPTSTPSPFRSGHTSPSHPLPSNTTSPTVHPDLTAKLAISNFIKSVIVFTLSGLVHDCGIYSMLLLNTPDHAPAPPLVKAFVLTPFFVAQPFGLVAEALLKAKYRQWKSRAYPRWKENGYPRNVILMEKVVGFMLTWVWLGWSAGWFVEGVIKAGMFDRGEGKPVYPSLLGGLAWGKWHH